MDKVELHFLFVLSTPLLVVASSITSSWYKLPKCINSTETPASITFSLLPSPNSPASKEINGLNLFPPAEIRYCEISVR